MQASSPLVLPWCVCCYSNRCSGSTPAWSDRRIQSPANTEFHSWDGQRNSPLRHCRSSYPCGSCSVWWHSLSESVGTVSQRCSARIFALPARTGRPGGMKQPPGKSAQCLKSPHRIWRADANFLLATEPEMCYNIPVKTTIATAPPEKPGSTTCRAVTTIPASADSSMQTPLPLRDRDFLDLICLLTA